MLLLGRPYHLDPGLNHGVLEEFQALGYPVLSIRSIPKDPKWLARFFKDDLERGFVQSPLDVSGRVAGELLGQQRAEGVGGQVRGAPSERRGARSVELQVRPRRADLRLIDSIISSSGTPYSALHDIDANKPGGSIKIRVQDLRAHAVAPRGAAPGPGGEAIGAAAHASTRSGASCCATRAAARWRGGAARSRRASAQRRRDGRRVSRAISSGGPGAAGVRDASARPTSRRRRSRGSKR